MKLERRARLFALAGTLAVLVWRIGAALQPHPADTDPLFVQRILAGLGVLFLVSGLVVLLRLPNRLGWVFAAYGFTGGIHWGGPWGPGSPPTQTVLLALYALVSVASQCLFLDLAWSFPPASAVARRLRRWIYLPVFVGIALWLVVALDGPNDRLGATALSVLWPLVPIGVLLSWVGGVLWIRRWWLASRATRRQHHLSAVVLALVAGFVPHALASSVAWPGPTGLANLAFVGVPVALGAAVLSTAAGSSD